MKAELKPRINMEGRTRLETVIPLSTPYLVFLDPSSLCNAKCDFCPTGRGENRKYYTPSFMDWGLYTSIIDDLAGMPDKVKTLRLYKDGESLLNPQFTEMVQYAKATGRFGQIDVTTNGSLLSPMMNMELIWSGLDKIFISVPAKYSQKYVDNVKHLYERGRNFLQIYVKTIGDTLSVPQKRAFMENFGDISDRIFIENRINCWSEFNSGDNPPVGIYGNPLTNVKVCPYPLYSVSINHDGTVSVCYLDWPHKMIVGDLKKESFGDIWNGKKLRDFQIMQLQGERKGHSFCCDCHQLTHGCPDDIDDYAQDILNKL